MLTLIIESRERLADINQMINSESSIFTCYEQGIVPIMAPDTVVTNRLEEHSSLLALPKNATIDDGVKKYQIDQQDTTPTTYTPR